MNKRILLYLTLALIIAVQSCKKDSQNQKNTQSNVSSDVGTRLKITAAGQYATFQISSANGNLSAEVANFGLADGSTSDMAAYTGTAHQQWRISDLGTGYYKIMNGGSGKFAQSYLYAGAQRFIQVYDNTSDSQLWSIVSVGPGYYKITNKANGLALTNSGAGILSLTPYANNNTQWWNLSIIANQAYRDDAVVNFFHRTGQTQGSVAFDQGSSIPLSDGRVLWVAEDSFDGVRILPDGNLMCGFFQYHNSILIQPSITTWNPNLVPNMTITNSTAGQPRQICNTQPNTDWSWPGVGIQIGDTAYMYCGEGKGLGVTNQSLYKLSQTGATNVWNSVRITPAGLSGQTDVGFSSGFVKPGDGFVYVYGGKGIGFNANQLQVARFPESNPQSWTFWNGTSWGTTVISTAAASIAHTQQNVTISYVKGKYVMMVLDLGFFCDPSSHSIYLATATSPTGPFTPLKKVFTIEDMYRGHLNRYYTPMIHAESDNGKNELLLTYSVNFAACSTGDDCANNELQSINYQVKGVRVPYSIIGL